MTAVWKMKPLDRKIFDICLTVFKIKIMIKTRTYTHPHMEFMFVKLKIVFEDL